MTRSIYHILTGWIHTRWLGGLQAAFVVRSLYLRRGLTHLLKGQAAHVLDLGSGEQASMAALHARRFHQCRFLATDVFLVPPENYPENLDLLVQDFEHPALKGSFDLIYTLDVLEHLHNPKDVIQNLADWLRPGGTLLIHTPSTAQINFFRKAKHADQPMHRPIRKGDLHLREGFQLEELRELLKKAGLRTLSIRYTMHPLLWFFKEIYTLGERKRIPGIGILILPFMVALTTWEMVFPPRRGNGLWAEAVK